jgi:hypothetical protein
MALRLFAAGMRAEALSISCAIEMGTDEGLKEGP